MDRRDFLQRSHAPEPLHGTLALNHLVLVPKGHHPCGAPYGYEMYYLNVMAGPLRKWRFQNDPDHDWIAQRDA
jgi:5-deoxy-glucuronate isomerase